MELQKMRNLACNVYVRIFYKSPSGELVSAIGRKIRFKTGTDYYFRLEEHAKLVEAGVAGPGIKTRACGWTYN